jgi:hypothetical protein
MPKIHYIVVDEFAQTVSDPDWPASPGDDVCWLPSLTNMSLLIEFVGNGPFGDDDDEIQGRAGEPIKRTIKFNPGPGKQKRFKYRLTPTVSSSRSTKKVKRLSAVAAAASEPEVIVDGGGGGKVTDPDGSSGTGKSKGKKR